MAQVFTFAFYIFTLWHDYVTYPQSYTMTETIKNLLEAVAVSPDNVPLRLHLAELMLSEKMYGEAGEHFREVLQIFCVLSWSRHMADRHFTELDLSSIIGRGYHGQPNFQ
jgi:hypothetical protein